MALQKDKYTFPSKDDLSSYYYFKSYIKRKIESYKEKNPEQKEEIKLRNRSTKNKKVKNENFTLGNILLCLSICSKQCKIENYKMRKIPPSIEGLNCDQIDDFLFASQRLTNKVINNFDLLNKLKELKVGLIVNCEMEGEHPLCGDAYYNGLDNSGFAYSTSLLEKNGIEVFLCGWNDLCIPDSFYHLIKIIKKMYYYINVLNKKIIVHCHAGYGRTAIVLSCYNIFINKVTANKAREMIRKGGRRYCLGSHIQFNYCKEFAKYMEIISANFYEKNKKDITIFKINEKMLNVGKYKFKYFMENKYFEYVPIFLLYIFERIIGIKKENMLDENEIYNSILNYNKITKEEEKIIDKIIKEINKYNWEEINKCDNLIILGNILFKWLYNSINYVINPKLMSTNNEINHNSQLTNLNKSTKIMLDFICKFLRLIKDNIKYENNKKLNDFLLILSPSLLGYKLEDIKISKAKQNEVNNLNDLILYVYKN